MYEYKCKIRRVVDGDTVDVDIDLGFDVVLSNQRIRLYGIDTPESRTRDKEEKKAGYLAKEFLEHHLGETAILRTRLDDARGKYGRILGEFPIYDEKTDATMTVNDIMIRERLAVAYHGQSKDDVKEEQLANIEYLFEVGLIL